ncbi:tetratricopeptide repeat protein [Pseudooceanicola sp.]|uniref:tetratricopeptide repeat protein n=1 Tax=Pseudooceanicola sp. TaxID=1914328 RepID=UPI002621E7D5|nr:tetratricopeptide repeat protein [Pseudooceanicola sp.]MDF1855323.1 tetratricopeptide repeat protein [Pseudooceanicola sp.]
MSSKQFRAVVAAALIAAIGVPTLAQGTSGDYLAARQARLASDYRAAVHYYIRALGSDPENAQMLEGAALSQLSLGELERAVSIARRMDDAAIRSQVASMVLIADDVAAGRWQGVLDRVAADKGIGPLIDGLLSAWARVGLGDMTGALAGFDAVAEQRGLASFAHYHRALALAMVGDYEAAEAIYAGQDGGSLQMTRRGAMARIEVLSQLGQPGEALKLMAALFGGDLDPALAAMKQALEAGEVLPFSHARSAADGVAEVFYSVAVALRGEAGYDYTLLYSRVAEYLRRDHIDALLMSAELLEDLHRPELAVETYRRVPRDNPAFHAAELGRAAALRAAGRDDAALEVLAQLATTHGDLAIVHATMGDILRTGAQYEAAIRAYEAALELYAVDDNGRWFAHYARGICYERLGERADAEADFRAALELRPDQPQVLNYLGYSLVEANEKLDEALSMIERAAAAQPDSGYIIDSLGWVLYRLGRYEEAVGHMEHATELMPVDPVVNDHLGDVYWAVGREMEAQFQWQRALSFGPEEPEAARIRRKIKVGLHAVLAEEGAEPLTVAGDDR